MVFYVTINKNMKNLIKSILNKNNQEVIPEAFWAYFHRLPQKISVEWFRDGKFIVGRIDAEGDKFMTQGVSADEFIEMVNDALFSFYEIPVEYFGALKSRSFVPKPEEYEKLNDAAVVKSKMGLEKRN